MNHNRTWYNKKLLVVMTVSGSAPEFQLVLPRWMDQIRHLLQIIVVDQGCQRSLIPICKKLAEGHGWSFGVDDFNANLVFTKAKDSLPLYLKHWVNLTNPQVIAVTDHKTIPAAFFLDAASIALDDKSYIKFGNTVVFPKTLLDFYASGFENCKALKPSAGSIIPDNNEYIPRITVYIPCMDRLSNLMSSLKDWFTQHYPNYNICIIDYSSQEPIIKHVQKLALEYGKTFSSDPNKDADVILLRIDGMEHFNISHAYNYAISKVHSDIISTACADSVPWNYYLDSCYNCLNDNTLVQIHWGLHTITYDNWKRLNGHQEFIVGWGAEDDDFRIRAILMGLTSVILPAKLVYQIPTEYLSKSINRKVKDASESRLTNFSRFQLYNARHGYCGNYNKPIGQDQPIDYVDDVPITPILRLWCFHEAPQVEDTTVKFSKEFDVYYRIASDEWTPAQVGVSVYDHFYIDSYADVDKMLYLMRKKTV